MASTGLQKAHFANFGWSTVDVKAPNLDNTTFGDMLTLVLFIVSLEHGLVERINGVRAKGRNYWRKWKWNQSKEKEMKWKEIC